MVGPTTIKNILQLGLKKPIATGIAASGTLQSDDVDAVTFVGPAVRVLTKPIARSIGSRLEETINALPDDFVMKERGVKNYLKRFANQTGTGIKDEEFDFSKLLDETSSKRITKEDLQSRIQSRQDIFSVTKVVGEDAKEFHSGTILSDFDSYNYRVFIRRYRNVNDTIDDRKTSGHMTRLGIVDELFWSRKSDITINGNKGTISWEGQSDQLNTGSTVGFNPQESADKLKTALEKDLNLEKTILKMQNRIDELNLLNDTAANSLGSRQPFLDWLASPEAAELKHLLSITSRKDRQKAGYKPNLIDIKRDKRSSEKRIKRISETINIGETKFSFKFTDIVNIRGEIGGEVSKVEDILSKLNIPIKGDESKKFIAFTALDMIKLKDLKKQLIRIELNLEDLDAIPLDPSIFAIEARRSKKLMQENAIKNLETRMNDRITDFYNTNNVRTNIKGQFGLVPQELPLSSNVWVEKWIEQDLVDAYLDGKNFFAIPIEPGGSTLVRGENVSDFYETIVVSTMERKVNQLNKEILKHNPNATVDNMFSFELFISKKSEDGINFTNETGINKFVYEMSEEDINFILQASPKIMANDANKFIKLTDLHLLPNRGVDTGLNMFDEKRVADRAAKLLDDKVYTNFEHAFYEAKRQEVIQGLQQVGVKQAKEALEESFGPNGINLIKKASHKLGMIYLPTKSIVKSKVLRSIGEQEKRLDQKETVNYVKNASIEELKLMMESIKGIEFENLYTRSRRFTSGLDDDFFKPQNINEVLGRIELNLGESQFQYWEQTVLNEIGEGRVKAELLSILNDLPSLAIEKVASVTGIKLKPLISDTEIEILPTWLNRINTYSVIPVAGLASTEETIANIESSLGIELDEHGRKSVIGRLRMQQDERLKAEISKSLKDPGVTNRNIVDFLVNNRGRDRDEIEGIVDAIITEKVASRLKLGVTPNQMFDLMLKKGYNARDILGYLPSPSFLENILDFTLNNLEMTKSMVSGIMQVLTGITPQSDNVEDNQEDKVSDIMGKVDAAKSTVFIIMSDLSIPLTTSMALEAKQQSNALSIVLIESLKKEGINFTVNKDGDILLPDANGQMVPFTVNFYDIMIARKDEVMGAFGGAYAGAKAGAKVPGPPIVKAIGVVVGAAAGSLTGTAIGRGSDILRSHLYLKQEIDGKFIMDEMIRTGAADGIISGILVGLFKAGGGTWKLGKWAYDKVARGNLEGGHRALMEYLHMTTEQANKQVDDWVKLNPEAAKDLSSSEKLRQFEVLSRTDPLAYRVAQPAMNLNSQASINMSREVNKRQLDIINTISKKTSSQPGSVLNEALPQYEKRVEDIYDGTKNYIIAQFKNSDYVFDYDKLAIEPTLRNAIEGIDNPAIHDQAQALFQRIRTIGGKQIKAEDGTVFDLPNPRRTFGDLLELRELVVKFSQKKNITGKKDIAKIESMIKNIDLEITRAVRGNVESANTWLKAWKDSKQAFDNMVQLKSNVLYKAIIKTGTTDKAIMNALVKAAQSLDGTYREVLQALPKKLHAPTEAALLKELIERATIKSVGGEEGLQAIDFVTLEKQLRHIPFGTKGNQEFKQAIGVMARVFKNDPHLLAASGTVRGDAFATFLTTDPEARIKYAFMTKVFNYVTRLLPGESGRKAAMLIKLGQVLRKPLDSVVIDDLLKVLPQDPILQNQLKAQIAEIADYNVKSVFPKVTVYGTSKVGHTGTPTKGILGTGRYFYITKSKARKSSKVITGSKLHTEDLLDEHIADINVIRDTLGLSDDTVITAKMIKESKILKQMLEDKAYNGIIFKDTIMIF